MLKYITLSGVIFLSFFLTNTAIFVFVTLIFTSLRKKHNYRFPSEERTRMTILFAHGTLGWCSGRKSAEDECESQKAF